MLDVLRRGASLYVHGHSAGGTNPSLVEAMYLGLPVVAFDVDYNRETTRGAGLYFSDPESLAETVRRVGPEELRDVGNKLQELANEHYLWKRIADAYRRLIQSIVK